MRVDLARLEKASDKALNMEKWPCLTNVFTSSSSDCIYLRASGYMYLSSTQAGQNIRSHIRTKKAFSCPGNKFYQ